MMRDLVAIIAPIVGSVLGYMSAKMERKGNEIDLSREIKKSVADNESLRIENSNLQIEVNNLKEKIRILESDNAALKEEFEQLKNTMKRGKK